MTGINLITIYNHTIKQEIIVKIKILVLTGHERIALFYIYELQLYVKKGKVI